MNESTYIGNASLAELPKSIISAVPQRVKQRHYWLLAALVIPLLSGITYASYVYRDRVKTFFQPAPPTANPTTEPVSVAGPGQVRVTPDSIFESKLEFDQVAKESVSAPLLVVSGSIVARLTPGSDSAEGRWDFASPEIALTYGDWIRARADAAFNESQVERVKNLVKARIDQLTEDVIRWESLVKIGTEAQRDLATAKHQKAQAELQGSTDIFKAETDRNTAIRNRELLERQLLQAGIDPAVVLKGKDGLILVVVDVPEAKVSLVHEGQPCTAKFYSYPDTLISGRVGRIGPNVTKDRRTLRVTFELEKVSVRLLPGMYAEIGLGTGERDLYTVPAESVLHIGKKDYVLIHKDKGSFEAREVVVGEPSPGGANSNKDSRIVVLSGLKQGERIVSGGAILLKPAVVKSLSGSTS
jgi:hypothetical protein